MFKGFERVLTRHFAGGKRPSRPLAPLPGGQYIGILNGGDAMTDPESASATGTVSGGLRTLLRLEGLTLFAGMTLLYAVWGGSWWIYAVLFLAPDLSFAGYFGGPQVGAVVYNAAHSYMAPVTLMTLGFGFASPLTLSIALIWMAHIGLDRALGYGLKYFAGFTHTHLGRIGPAAKAPVN
jgi:Domain of unknown function (DUF4260)